MSTHTDVNSADYLRNHAVFSRALGELHESGVELIDPVTIPDLLGHLARGMDANVYETRRP